MRRLILIVGIVILVLKIYAQNGFDIAQLDINPTAYCVDENGIYWIVDNDRIYKYDGAVEATFDVENTNMDYSLIKNIWLKQESMYIVTESNVYLFDPENPNNSVDLEFNRAVSSSFFDGQNLAVVSVIDVGILGIEIYNGESWSYMDILPGFSSIEGMAFYNESLYIAIRNYGVYKYANGLFEEVLEGTYYDMIVWDGKLWLTDGQTFGIWENNSYFQWNMQAGLSGGRHFMVCNNELWSGSYDRLFHLEADHISEYEAIEDIHLFPNFGSVNDSIQYVYSNKLVTFDPSQYISDPEFIGLDNTIYTTINNVEAMFNVFGSFFWDLQNEAHYFVPDSTRISTMFAGALWLAGKDADGFVHAAYEKYFDDGPRFTPGPLDDNLHTSNQVRDAFNRIWHIDRATIENFKYRYELGDITNGSWPVDYFIDTWPAHGQDGYADNIAPFVDVNHDGHYNPLDGDYPDILGDEMLYWVVNDNNHNAEGFDTTRNIGVEMHYKVWANRYENPITGNLDDMNDTAELINNSIFMDVDIINRSSNIYHDFYVGIWTDGDLGYSEDDYVGLDVMNHSIYYINGDEFDDPSGTPPGYGSFPPAQSVTFLDAPIMNSLPLVDTGCYISKFISYERSGGINGDPVEFDDFYNYLSGKWLDGSNITWGGYGIDTNSIVCDYMYPGDSDLHNIGTGGVEMGEWSENGESHFPGDKSTVASNGPLVLFPGDTVSLRFAFSYVRDMDSSFPYSLNKLRELLPLLHQWQRTGSFPSKYDISIVSAGVSLKKNENWDVQIYPNPSSEFIIVKSQKTTYSYRIYDLGGRVLLEGNASENNKLIDLHFLTKGLYLMSFESDGDALCKKLIVQ